MGWAARWNKNNTRICAGTHNMCEKCDSCYHNQYDICESIDSWPIPEERVCGPHNNHKFYMTEKVGRDIVTGKQIGRAHV